MSAASYPLAPISYYERQRRAFAATELAGHALEDYEFPLETWGHHCEATREARRELYRCGDYADVSRLEEIAHRTFKLFSKDGSREIKVLLVFKPVSEMELDAVVNSANEAMLGGGGVDQQIHEGAGPGLIKECATRFIGNAARNACEIAEVKLTKGHALPASYVLHTVAPLLSKDGSPQGAVMGSCYQNCLKVAQAYSFRSIAFPCLGCGFYGFPLDLSIKLVLSTLSHFVETEASALETVILSLGKDREQEAYCAGIDAFVASRI